MRWSSNPPAGKPVAPEVHIWRARLDAPDLPQEDLNRLLTEEERDRAGRFRFDVLRRRYTASRAVLRILLSRYLDISAPEIAIVYNAHGKPELLDRGLELQFNLTHAADMAVYAFATGRRVGVDIEEMSRDVSFRALAARFFSHDERAVIDSLPDEDVRTAFYECWTRKEAYIKALGLGVTHGLDNFSVAIGAHVRPALLHSDVDEDAPRKWGMCAFDPADGFVGAVVVEGVDCVLKGFEVST
ncbi:MAG: 4'-phosphopantetheinyl transferase superfamily protein [Rhodothermales bacterium]|nr:4'-phosphopantetheinyl transferase superfamily protein [Rhodothermales bacterium]